MGTSPNCGRPESPDPDASPQFFDITVSLQYLTWQDDKCLDVPDAARILTPYLSDGQSVRTEAEPLDMHSQAEPGTNVTLRGGLTWGCRAPARRRCKLAAQERRAPRPARTQFFAKK